jgi:hypothetical protein
MSAVPVTLIDGSKTVAAVGTPEALSSSRLVRAVAVQAKRTNATSVFVGNSTTQNWELTPGSSVSLGIENLADVFVRVTTAGEGVNFLAVTS